jgi:predicted glutamine amidotransferase
MCRWLAYAGSPIGLDEILLRPEHSLLTQSRHARESTFEVNADGFGVGWYTGRPTPGVYHDTRPAWNDRNLASLAAHIRSPLFFGHIRAAVGSMVVRSNC